MAKKRKSTKSSAARASKKKASASKKKTRKPARRILVKKPRTGLESHKEVDFKPLKTQLRAHIERLGSVKEPSPAVANALRSLREVSDALSAECSPSMILPTA